MSLNDWTVIDDTDDTPKEWTTTYLQGAFQQIRDMEILERTGRVRNALAKFKKHTNRTSMSDELDAQLQRIARMKSKWAATNNTISGPMFGINTTNNTLQWR